ncbi:MAG: HD domain-containing phosphohydrolase [Chloroflexota bacterium]
MYWTIATIVSAIATVIFLTLFGVVFLSKTRTQLHKLFLYYLISMLFWSISAFLASSGLVAPLFWFRAMAISPVVMLFFLFLFVQKLFGLRNKWVPTLLIYGIFAMFVDFFTDLVIKSAYLDEAGSFVYEFGIFLPIIALPFFIITLYSLVILYRIYKNSKDANNRNRLRYLMLGISLPIFAITLNFTELGKYPIDIATNVITAILISYAILRHQLLDVKVVVRLGLIYSITTALFGSIYFLVISLVLNLFHLLAGNEVFITSIIVGTLFSFVLAPLNSRAKKWIDRLFYREKFNAGQMMQRLSQTTASIMNLDIMADLILREILTTWHIQNGTFLIKKNETGDFLVAGQKGNNLDHSWRFPSHHPIPKWLMENKKNLSRDDLSLNPKFKSLWGTEINELEEINAQLFVPLLAKGDLVGIIILGEKKSTLPFDRDDLLLLSAMSNQVAVAIENSRLYEDLESAFIQTTVALANAIDLRDAYTNIHSQQIAFWSAETAKIMECSPEDVKDIYWGGLLHDIGKIGIPDAILNKPGKLDSSEWEVVHRHPDLGAELIAPIKKLSRVAPIINCSHERYDGKGYPRGLRKEEIPLGARIVSVADSYSAMKDQRPYKEPMSDEMAIQELVDNSGKMYDPEVVDAFLKMIAIKKNKHVSSNRFLQ